MNVLNIPRFGFSSNCYLVCNNEGTAFVVDPSAKAEKIIEAATARNCTIKGILLTHGHFDHMLHLQELRDLTGAPVYIHSFDAPNLSDAHLSLFYAFARKNVTFDPPEYSLSDMETIQIGEFSILVRHTPGHTMGSVCYCCENVMFSGDTLLLGTVGRTDLLGGNPEAMEITIEKLSAIQEDYTVYPGHEEPTTLFFEQKHNPFFQEKSHDRF